MSNPVLVKEVNYSKISDSGLSLIELKGSEYAIWETHLTENASFIQTKLDSFSKM